MFSLYQDFMDWLEYNFPAIELSSYQEKLIRSVFTEPIPGNGKELAERLKDLLPAKTAVKK